MNPKVKELRQQRAALVSEMHDLTEKTSFPEESQKRWDDLDKQQKALESQIQRMEQTDKLLEEQRAVNAPPQADPGAGDPENRGTPSGPEAAVKAFRQRLESSEYRAAFVDYLRSGTTDCARESRKMLDDTLREARTYTGLNVGTGNQGGYVVPVGFQKDLETKMKAWGRMRQNCQVITTTTGAVLDWPTMDDTANSGHWIAENQAVSQTNPTFGQVQLSAYLGSSDQVLFSFQLLQDSAFDLEAKITDAFGIRLGRLTNAAYTNGTGSGTPTGLVYTIKNDSVPNVVNATGSNTNDGASGSEASTIGSDDLDNLISSVDPAYRQNGRFMMHWKTIDYLRKLKDKYGRPLWVSSLAVGEPDRIFGYPYDWNADMDLIGAGNYPVLYGDFSKYIIRDAAGITVVRFNELFMSNHQVGFQAFLRTEGQRLQQAAFGLLRNPLS